MTSLTAFGAPSSAQLGAPVTLTSTTTKAGTVVYKIPDTANVTFDNGKRVILKAITPANPDSTDTSFVGVATIFTLTATFQGETDSKTRTITVL